MLYFYKIDSKTIPLSISLGSTALNHVYLMTWSEKETFVDVFYVKVHFYLRVEIFKGSIYPTHFWINFNFTDNFFETCHYDHIVWVLKSISSILLLENLKLTTLPYHSHLGCIQKLYLLPNFCHFLAKIPFWCSLLTAENVITQEHALAQ